MNATTRLARVEDADQLARLQSAGREFFDAWDPVRDESYYTAGGQRAEIEKALAQHSQDAALPQVILDEEHQVIGRVTLSSITRGPFQSCAMGYWVGQEFNGRGYATAAVEQVTRIAFDELGLHRVQAGTLVHNARSQHVLERNGFARIGLAPGYLKIAGRWQDHILFQLLSKHDQS